MKLRYRYLLFFLAFVLFVTIFDIRIPGVYNFTVTLKTPEPVKTPFVVRLAQAGGSWGLARTTTTVYEEVKVLTSGELVTFDGDTDLVDGHSAALEVFHPHYRAVQNPQSLEFKYGSQENQQGLQKGAINAIDKGDWRYHYEVELLTIEQALDGIRQRYQGRWSDEEVNNELRGTYEMFLSQCRDYFRLLEEQGVKVNRQQFAQRYLDLLENMGFSPEWYEIKKQVISEIFELEHSK